MASAPTVAVVLPCKLVSFAPLWWGCIDDAPALAAAQVRVVHPLHFVGVFWHCKELAVYHTIVCAADGWGRHQ